MPRTTPPADGIPHHFGCLSCETKWHSDSPICWMCGATGVYAHLVGPGFNSGFSCTTIRRWDDADLDDLTGAAHP